MQKKNNYHDIVVNAVSMLLLKSSL